MVGVWVWVRGTVDVFELVWVLLKVEVTVEEVVGLLVTV